MTSMDLKIVLLLILVKLAVSAVVTPNEKSETGTEKSALTKTSTSPSKPTAGDGLIQRSKKTYPNPRPIANSRLLKASGAISHGKEKPTSAALTSEGRSARVRSTKDPAKKVTGEGVRPGGPAADASARDHRSLRSKRFSAGSASPLSRARQQELLELLQLVSQNRNDLDPLANYLADGRNSERDLEAGEDAQPDFLSKPFRSSSPVAEFDQTEPALGEAEMDPDFSFDPEKGNEPSGLYQRLPLHQTESILSNRMRQVTPAVNSARTSIPSSQGWVTDRNADDLMARNDYERDSDLSLMKLAKVYEALLNANRD